MFTAYLIVTGLAAAANIFSAVCDFVRYKQVSIAMAKAGVAESWMTPLGILKASGALGLLVGIVVPWIATAPPSVLSCSLSVPSSSTCVRATIRSAWRPCSSCLLSGRWCCDWPRRERRAGHRW